MCSSQALQKCTPEWPRGPFRECRELEHWSSYPLPYPRTNPTGWYPEAPAPKCNRSCFLDILCVKPKQSGVCCFLTPSSYNKNIGIHSQKRKLISLYNNGKASLGPNSLRENRKPAPAIITCDRVSMPWEAIVNSILLQVGVTLHSFTDT